MRFQFSLRCVLYWLIVSQRAPRFGLFGLCGEMKEREYKVTDDPTALYTHRIQTWMEFKSSVRSTVRRGLHHFSWSTCFASSIINIFVQWVHMPILNLYAQKTMEWMSIKNSVNSFENIASLSLYIYIYIIFLSLSLSLACDNEFLCLASCSVSWFQFIFLG